MAGYYVNRAAETQKMLNPQTQIINNGSVNSAKSGLINGINALNGTTTVTPNVTSTVNSVKDSLTPAVKILSENGGGDTGSTPNAGGSTPVTGGVSSGSAPTAGGGGTSATAVYENYLNQILADQKAASDARQKALTDNYNRAMDVLKQKHNDQVTNLQNDANDSMRQAYINYMMNQRGINQQLSNMGINGGATESVLANLYNNYGSNRNAIANELQKGLQSLGANYNSSVADLTNSYGNNLADVLADYYNQAVSAKENYANKIASALASAANSTSRSSGSTTNAKETSASTEYRPNGLSDGIWNGVKSVMSRYLNGDVDGNYLTDYMGGVMGPTDMYNVLYENGINPNAVGVSLASNNNATSTNNTTVSASNPTNIQPSAFSETRAINDLKQIRAYARTDAELRDAANAYLNKLMANGASQAQAEAVYNAVFS